MTTEKAFNDWQRQLDRDPIFQRLQDEMDKSWWQQQDNESQQMSRHRDNQESK